MTTETIIERIKALRAKVNNVGSTEAEVEAAARLVAKLMMQHDIDEESLTESKRASGAHAHTDKMKNELDIVFRYCWSGIQELTETRSYLDGGCIYYIGLDYDVETALYVFELIAMSARRGWFRHSAKMFDEQGATRTLQARASYYAGFGTSMQRVLAGLAEERKQARIASAGMTGTAIVLRKSDVIKEKMQELGLQLRKSRKKNISIDDSSAFYEGRDAAEKVDVKLDKIGPTRRVNEGKKIAATKLLGR